MGRQTMWIIAGPNGAGKTTLAHHPRFRRLLGGVPLLNPDAVTLRKLEAIGRSGFHDATADELRRCFVAAAEAVETELRETLARSEAAAVETVLSTRKYCPVVEQVLASGGFVGLIYIALRSADIARERVARRVAQGGHDVPADRLETRWVRSVENLGWFVRRASRFWVLDNSDSTLDAPPSLIAEGGGGQIRILDADAIPALTRVLKQAADG